MPSSSSSSTTAKGGGTTRQQQTQSQQQQHRRSTSPTKVQQPPHPSHEFTFAKRTLRKLVEDSTFFCQMDNNNDNNDDNPNHVGTIHERDVQVGALLGQGGFCEVRYCYTAAAAVKRKNPKLQQQQQHQEDGGGANETPSTTSSSNNNNNNHMGRYAIKYLSPTRTAPHPSDPKNKVFQRGIADLAMEACFLSLLSHTNIITCHYVSVGSLEENFNTEVDYTTHHHHHGGGGNAALGGGGKKVKKKKQFKEEIVLDAMGNLVLKEVPIITDNTGDDEGEDDSKQQEDNKQQQQQVEKYKHRFGYFLLLDVLHETLAHRIDHVYIPQVLLSSSSNTNIKGRPSSPSNASLGGCGSSSISSSSVPSTDLTSSLLLHTQEKRDSFLKRIAKRSSLFHKQHQNNNRGSVVDGNSSSAPGIRSITYANNNNNNNHHHHDNNDNVEVQLQQQHQQQPHSTSSSHHSHPHNLIYNQKQKLAHRLTSLLSIANALQYLHEHKILFRDIKPDNIGFYREYSAVCTCGLRPSSSSSSAASTTTSGTPTTPFGGQQQQPQHQHDDNTMNDLCTCYIEIPKLFDFGLAKELKSKYRVEDGHTRLRANSRDYSEIKEYAHHDHHHRAGAGLLLGRNFSSSSSASGIGIGSTRNRITDEEMNTVYKLTGCTGSRRYMAPEVCFNDPYNEKADVYSFGMMLYQVASLVTPFDGYSSYDHEKEVLRGGFRPDIDLPTKKDLLACKKIEEELYANLGAGGSISSGEEDGGGGDNQLLLPPPSEKRNEVLAIKSKSVWTKDLKRLIDECWDYDMRYRPPMKEVVVRLQGCIDELILSPQQLLQQKQQQKKGRDSLEGKKMTDVIRGSRNNNAIHRQQGGNIGEGGKGDNVEGMTKQKVGVGGAGTVEVRSNVSDEDTHTRESVKKKSFFRPPTSPRKESNGPTTATAAAIQQ